MKTIVFTSALLFCCIGFSSAQQATSPYTTSWLRDGLIIGGGLVNGIAASSFDDTVSVLSPAELAALNKENINAFDRWAASGYSPSAAKASDYLLGASLVAPFGLFAVDGIGKDWDKLTLMYMETMLWSALLPSYTKGTVQRIRPFAYNTNAPLERRLEAETRRSFFSGHTCLAFSSVVFLSAVYANYYPDSHYKTYVWAGSLLLAGSVGYLRIESGAHFPTDVLVGAAVGSVVGYLIPVLHRKGSGSDGASLQLYPGGVQMSYAF